MRQGGFTKKVKKAIEKRLQIWYSVGSTNPQHIAKEKPFCKV
jgi:hypothetical protein